MLTAEENITLPLSIAGEKPDKAFFDELLGARSGSPTGARTVPRSSPAASSSASRSRGRSSRARPCVFADEPTGNLDSTTGGEILELLRDSVDELGQTIVMVTHEARAAAIADRILFLADGQIVRELGEDATRRRSRSSRDDGRDRRT